MILCTTMVAIMLYLDRVCLSILGTSIKKDLDFNEVQFANLLSAFFWAYALCQIPAGWIGDRYGPRIALGIYLFFWSLCTGLMGMVSGYGLFLLLRLGCGLFEAGAYPLANGIVRKWVPLSGRGTASGIVAIGGRLGGAIAPMLTNFLAAGASDGWRKPFIIYGIIGMVGAIIFWVWYRDEPSQHPLINQAEIDLINGTNHVPDSSKPGFPNFFALATNLSLWLASIVMILSNFGWIFIITLFPDYLEKVFGTPADTRAFYQSLPLYFGIAGMLIGGWWTDRIFRLAGPRWGRSIPMAASRVIVGLSYIVCLFLGDALWVTIMMCVVAAATDMGNPAFWAYCQDVGGKYVGSVVGWGNMWGNLGAAIAPQLFILIKSYHPDDPKAGWASVFLVCAVVQVIGAVAAMGIDATHPIKMDGDKSPSTSF